MTKKVIKTWKYKAGYDVRYEEFSGDDAGGESFVMRSAYTPNGDYIGNPKRAKGLAKMGIKPEKVGADDDACSVGVSEKTGMWYGWSHRSMYGFAIGDVVKEGDCTASSGWIDEYLEEHPEADLSLPVGFEAKTLEDTKRMAISFAESVG